MGKETKMRLEPLDQTQQSIVSKAIQDAVDFIDDEIELKELKPNGIMMEVDIGHEEGAVVVSTKCRKLSEA